MPPSLDARLRIEATQDFDQTYPLRDPWSATISAHARFDAGLEAKVRPPADISLLPPSGALSIEVDSGLQAARPGQLLLLLGQAGGSRLEVQRFAVAAGLRAAAAVGSSVVVEPSARAELAGGHLLIDLSSGDGFISAVTGGGRIDSNFDVKALWSPSSGPALRGQRRHRDRDPHAHLDRPDRAADALPAHRPGADGSVPIELSAGFSAKLGPLQASVDRIGLIVRTRFPPGGGNLGAGRPRLRVQAAERRRARRRRRRRQGRRLPVLRLRPRRVRRRARARRSPASSALKAIGLITTRMPDGSRGLLAADHHHRGVRHRHPARLRLHAARRRRPARAQPHDAARRRWSRACAPARSTASCSRTTSSPTRRGSSATCATFFPPRAGHVPDRADGEARLGHADAGQPLARRHHRDPRQHRDPRRAARSRCRPTRRAAHRAAGRTSSARSSSTSKRVWFFAALFESRILFMTHRGRDGAAGRVRRRRRTSCCRVGGFHPRFNPPPLPFPTPKRIALDILNTPVARIRVEGYFAVTIEHRAVRRARRSCSSASSVAQRRGPPRLRRAVPVLAVLLHRRDLGGVLAQGVRRRAVQHPPATSRSRARRRGARTAPARSRFFFFDVSTSTSTSPGASAATPTLPPIAVHAAADRRARQGRELARRAPGRRQPAGRRCASCRDGRARWCCTRSARCASASAPCRSTSTIDKVGNQKPSDAQPLHARRPRSAAWPSAATRDEQFAPAQFQDLDDADEAARSRRSSPSTAASSSPSPGAQLSSGAAVRSGACATSRSSSTRTTGASAGASALHARLLFDHFLAGAAVAQLAARRSASKTQLDAVRRQGRRSTDDGLRRRAHARQHGRSAPRPRRSPARRRRSEFLAERGCAADPDLADTLHVDPAVRGGGRMTDPLGTYSFLLAAPRAREQDHAADQDPTSSCARTRRRAAEARRASRSAAARRSRDRSPRRAAVRAGRHRRHRAARDRHAPSRATGSPTSSRTTCRRSSSTTRTSPGATRRPRPTTRAAAAAVARAGRARGGRVRRRRERRRASRCRSIERRRRGATFPPADELWAWAHVHVNRDLAASDGEIVVDRHGRRAAAARQTRSTQNPDLAYSRLLCPRKLEAEHGVPRLPHPDVRTGRLRRPRPRPGRRARSRPQSAWGRRRPDQTELPVLPPLVLPHRHDRRLRVPRAAAQAAAGRHARRHAATWTCSSPGCEPAGHRPTRRSAASCGSAARCACRATSCHRGHSTSRRQVRELGRSRYPHPFQQALAELRQSRRRLRARRRGGERRSRLRPDDRARSRSADHPAAVRPLARADRAAADGPRRHAAAEQPTTGSTSSTSIRAIRVAGRLRHARHPGAPGGLHERRLAAGRRRARGQPPHPLRAAGARRCGELARRSSSQPLAASGAERGARRSTAPVQRARAWPAASTVAHRRARRASCRRRRLSTRRCAASCARAARADARAAVRRRAIAPRQPARRASNAGEVSAAPAEGDAARRARPSTSVADRRSRRRVPPWLVDLLRRVPWLPLASLVALAVLLVAARCLLAGAAAAGRRGLVVAGALVALSRLLRALRRAPIARRTSCARRGQTPAAVDALPPSPDFALAEPRRRRSRRRPARPTARRRARFKTALRDCARAARGERRRRAARPAPQRRSTSRAIARRRVAALDPDATIPRRALRRASSCPTASSRAARRRSSTRSWPTRRSTCRCTSRSTTISDELFLPNLNLIEPNSITLLETNQKFIEAYMVGLNHEIARELLWREYPDRPARQLLPPVLGRAAASLPERRRATDALTRAAARHPASSTLDADLRARRPRQPRGARREARRSSCSSSAASCSSVPDRRHLRARGRVADDEADGADRPIDKQRELRRAPAGRGGRPAARQASRTPLYEAKVEPDIYFFGFDLTADEADGGDGDAPERRARLVLRDQGAARRAALRPRRSAARQAAMHTWNDLAWDDVGAGGRPERCVPATEHRRPSPSTPPTEPARPSEKHEQHGEDAAGRTGARDRRGAMLAYILYQVPVMVAVHAAEMLPIRRDAARWPTSTTPTRRSRARAARAARRRAAARASASRASARAGSAPGGGAARRAEAERRGARWPQRLEATRARLRRGSAGRAAASGGFARVQPIRATQRRRSSTTTFRCCCFRCGWRRASRPSTCRARPDAALGAHLSPTNASSTRFEPTLTEAEVATPRPSGARSGTPAASRPTSAPRGAGSSAQPRLGPRQLDRPPASARRTRARREPTKTPTPTDRRSLGECAVAHAPLHARPSAAALGDLLARRVASRRRRARASAARRRARRPRSARRAPPSCASVAPFNLNDAPPPPASRATTVAVAPWLRVAARHRRTATRARSWSRRRPRRCCPSGFVLVGLPGPGEVLERARRAGADAAARRPRSRCPDAATQLQFDADGNLTLPDELRWMVDFDAAVQRGMGFRVTLTPQQARGGFDRLFVLGCGSAPTPPRARPSCEALLANHRFGTQRLRAAAAGHADQQHRGRRRRLQPRTTTRTRASTIVVQARRASTTTDDWRRQARRPVARRGAGHRHRLAEAASERRRRLRSAEARAMNTALWPATLGYFMETLLKPVLSDDDVDADALVLHALRQRPRAAAGGAHRPAALRHPADDRVLAHRLAATAAERFAFATGFLDSAAACRSCAGRRRRLRGDWRAQVAGGRARRAPATIRTRALLDIARPASRLGRVPPALRRKPEGPVQRT